MVTKKVMLVVAVALLNAGAAVVASEHRSGAPGPAGNV
jgi:hypothetical protein